MLARHDVAVLSEHDDVRCYWKKIKKVKSEQKAMQAFPIRPIKTGTFDIILFITTATEAICMLLRVAVFFQNGGVARYEGLYTVNDSFSLAVALERDFESPRTRAAGVLYL